MCGKEINIYENAHIRSENKGISEKARIKAFLKSNSENQASNTPKHCPHCGEIVTSKNCAMCGKENNLFK